MIVLVLCKLSVSKRKNNLIKDISKEKITSIIDPNKKENRKDIMKIMLNNLAGVIRNFKMILAERERKVSLGSLKNINFKTLIKKTSLIGYKKTKFFQTN